MPKLVQAAAAKLDNVDTVSFEANDQISKAEEGIKESPELKPGETYPQFLERLAGLKDKLAPLCGL